MAWIELHQSLPTHRKTKKLARLLGYKAPRDIPQVVGHLAMLWLWAIDNVQDGALGGIDPQDISDASGWTREPNTFLDALRESGFVDGDLRIHDWDLYIGKLIDRRIDNARRNRESRARKKPQCDASRDVHDTVTSASRDIDVGASRDGATVPNQTQPYPTVPNQETTAGGAARAREPLGAAPSEGGTSGTAYLSAHLPDMTSGNWAELGELVNHRFGDDYDDGILRLAVDEAAAYGHRTWAYIRGILTRWAAAGISTPDQVRTEKAKPRAAAAGVSPRTAPGIDPRIAAFEALKEREIG